MKKNLIIRLQRSGRIGRPFFDIVVIQRQKSASASYIARVGYYDPFSTKNSGYLKVILFNDILNYWISKGAKPNSNVQRLLFK